MALILSRERTSAGPAVTASFAFRYPGKAWWVIAGLWTAILLPINFFRPSLTSSTALWCMVGFLAAPVVVKYGLSPLSNRVSVSGNELRVERYFNDRMLAAQVLEVISGARFELRPRRRLLGMDLFPGDSITYCGEGIRVPLVLRFHAAKLSDAFNVVLQEAMPG